MKLPQRPPDFWETFSRLQEEGRLASVMTGHHGPTARGKYLHWDRLRNYPPPEGLSHEEWWVALKFHRQIANHVPVLDKEGRAFSYVLTDPIPERLHEIDLGMGGQIQMPEQITNPDTRNRYYVRSLIEEAITSSQLEGAATTRRVAKDMIRAGRPPRDRHERMIINNYRTMQRIGKLKSEQLTQELVFEIHQLVTADTLDEPSAAGRFRREDEKLSVADNYGEVFHVPPAAAQLPERLDAMCQFANGRTPKGFLHPVLRSIILHFWLAYDHPFVDGNGRTARALFYWSMLHNDFWLCEYISISQIILKAPVKYARAFLYTETDDNDLTYFIIHQLEAIHRAVDELHEYIQKKTEQLRALERALQGMPLLNHRQRALVSHSLRHPDHHYTIKSHRVSHNVVYQTARLDLMNLEDLGLLRSHKIGKVIHFVPVENLERKLATLADERV